MSSKTTSAPSPAEQAWGEFNQRRQDWIANNPIAKWRDQQNLTNAAFAAAIGRNPLAIQHWITGQSSPSRDSRLALQTIFDQSGADGSEILRELDAWRLQRPTFSDQ